MDNKTAIREALDRLRIMVDDRPTESMTALGMCIAMDLLSELLEKERQQIISAGNKCQIVSDILADGEIRFLYKDGENYYNNTYNQ